MEQLISGTYVVACVFVVREVIEYDYLLVRVHFTCCVHMSIIRKSLMFLNARTTMIQTRYIRRRKKLDENSTVYTIPSTAIELWRNIVKHISLFSRLFYSKYIRQTQVVLKVNISFVFKRTKKKKNQKMLKFPKRYVFSLKLMEKKNSNSVLLISFGLVQWV